MPRRLQFLSFPQLIAAVLFGPTGRDGRLGRLDARRFPPSVCRGGSPTPRVDQSERLCGLWLFLRAHTAGRCLEASLLPRLRPFSPRRRLMSRSAALLFRLRGHGNPVSLFGRLVHFSFAALPLYAPVVALLVYRLSGGLASDAPSLPRARPCSSKIVLHVPSTSGGSRRTSSMPTFSLSERTFPSRVLSSRRWMHGTATRPATRLPWPSTQETSPSDSALSRGCNNSCTCAVSSTTSGRSGFHLDCSRSRAP